MAEGCHLGGERAGSRAQRKPCNHPTPQHLLLSALSAFICGRPHWRWAADERRQRRWKAVL